jgi:4-hydroxybenzoate polyprenyltransferase
LLVATGVLFLGALAFNFMSSVVYIINDIKDIAFDQQHASKKRRPYAAGTLTGEEVLGLAVMLLGLVFMICSVIAVSQFTILLLAYLSLNILYTYWLKYIPYVDITMIAVFAGMRVMAGFIILGLPISWFVVFFLMTAYMFFTSVQRLAESTMTGALSRPVLKKYNLRVLRFLMTTMMIFSVVAYFLAMAFAAFPLIYTDFLYFSMLYYIYEFIVPMQGKKGEAENGWIFLLRHRWFLSLVVVFVLTVVTIIILFL